MKLKQRQLQRMEILISGFFVLAAMCFIFYFQFFIIKKAYAATSFYTLNDGEWSTSIWSNTTSGGPNCTCNPG